MTARLEEATLRLERAVTRLETACLRFAGGESGDRQLALELAQARQAYEKLEKVTRAVATRLDGAIERLDSVIEG